MDYQAYEIKEKKDLFEYEMTEVLVNLRGEVSKLSNMMPDSYAHHIDNSQIMSFSIPEFSDVTDIKVNDYIDTESLDVECEYNKTIVDMHETERIGIHEIPVFTWNDTVLKENNDKYAKHTIVLPNSVRLRSFEVKKSYDRDGFLPFIPIPHIKKGKLITWSQNINFEVSEVHSAVLKNEIVITRYGKPKRIECVQKNVNGNSGIGTKCIDEIKRILCSLATAKPFNCEFAKRFVKSLPVQECRKANLPPLDSISLDFVGKIEHLIRQPIIVSIPNIDVNSHYFEVNGDISSDEFVKSVTKMNIPKALHIANSDWVLPQCSIIKYEDQRLEMQSIPGLKSQTKAPISVNDYHIKIGKLETKIQASKISKGSRKIKSRYMGISIVTPPDVEKAKNELLKTFI